MNIFEKITESPEALASLLRAIPAIETPWDEAFHRLYCSSCSAAGNTSKLTRRSFPHKIERDFTSTTAEKSNSLEIEAFCFQIFSKAGFRAEIRACASFRHTTKRMKTIISRAVAVR